MTLAAVPEAPPLAAMRPDESAVGAANPDLALLTDALRAPLIPIIGFAELLAITVPPGKAADHAGEVVAASRHLLAVTDHFLALAAGQALSACSDPALAATAAAAVAAARRLLLADVGQEAVGSGGIQRRVA